MVETKGMYRSAHTFVHNDKCLDMLIVPLCLSSIDFELGSCHSNEFMWNWIQVLCTGLMKDSVLSCQVFRCGPSTMRLSAHSESVWEHRKTATVSSKIFIYCSYYHHTMVITVQIT